MGRAFWKTTLALVALATACLGEVSVEASVDRNTAAPGDLITLTVTVSGTDIGKVSPPSFPESDKWSLSGTSSSTSTSIQMIGAKFSVTKTMNFQFYIIPQDTGELEIPPIDVYVDGKRYSTNPIKVYVAGGGAPPKTRGHTAQKPKSAPAGKDIFLLAIASPETAYVGQQVTVDFVLYTRREITNVSFERDAEFRSFWVENLFEAEHLSFQPAVVGGRRYEKTLIKSVAAFPLAPGDLTVEPMELSCTVYYPPRSFFDFGRQVKRRVKSNRLKIHILPLPDAGKPSNFGGAVGNFSISAKLDRNEVAVGDAVTLTISVTGDGNIEALELPKPQIPPDLEVFDTKERVKKRTRSGKAGGTKKTEYILIPRSKGEFSIPPVEFSYFDPRRRKYIVLTTDTLRLAVKPGAGGVSYAVGRAVVPVAGDIEFIKPDRRSLPAGSFLPWRDAKALWFLAVDALVIVLAFAYRRRQEHLLSNWRRVRASQALKAARRKLAEARKSKETHQALGAISDAVFGFVADKLETDVGAIILDDACAKLVERGAPQSAVDELKEILDRVDAARFAPSSTKIDAKKLAEHAEKVLKQIDEMI